MNALKTTQDLNFKNNFTSSSTNNSSTQQYNQTLYLLGAAGLAGILAGAYFIWSVLNDEEELDEKEVIEIEEIKEIVKGKGTIDKNSAIHILYLTNHHAEEELKRIKPDIEKRRREAFNNDYEYKSICSEFLEAKEGAYMRASQKILGEFNTTMEDLNKIMTDVDPLEMEKKFFEFEKPEFSNGKPDKIKTKEAFLFFGNKFMEEMQGLSSQFKNFQTSFSNPQAQEMAMFNLLVSKLKVEDLVYLKYQITENQIRFLLNDYDLLKDVDIQAMHTKIASFEEMMG